MQSRKLTLSFIRCSIQNFPNLSRHIRHGFVYDRVPHITLKAIANNTESDVIWDMFQKKMEPLRKALNKALKTAWEEWEIPRETDDA